MILRLETSLFVNAMRVLSASVLLLTDHIGMMIVVVTVLDWQCR